MSKAFDTSELLIMGFIAVTMGVPLLSLLFTGFISMTTEIFFGTSFDIITTISIAVIGSFVFFLLLFLTKTRVFKNPTRFKIR